METVTLSGAIVAFMLGALKGAVFGVLVAGSLLIILEAGTRLKRRHRQRKVDARIVRQAEAMGVWGDPKKLGGRALDIYARDFCGLKRRPGEADQSLRSRCMAAGLKYTDADWRKAEK